jgi:acylphosphatase
MVKKRAAIRMSGRVQGVGFRFFARDAAQERCLTGWVKNLWDRSVECEVQGAQADIDAFFEELRRGPPLSRVEEITMAEIPSVAGESSFEIIH